MRIDSSSPFRQCLETLDYIVDHSPIDERKLSKDGRTLVEDSRGTSLLRDFD